MRIRTKIGIGVGSFCLLFAGVICFGWYMEKQFDDESACRSPLFRNLKPGMTKDEVRQEMMRSDILFVRKVYRDSSGRDTYQDFSGRNLHREVSQESVPEVWRFHLRGGIGTAEARFDSRGVLVSRGCGGG